MKLIRFHSGSIIASLTWCLLVPIVVGIMSLVSITKSSNKRQVNGKICNLEREYRDCIKSRRDKIGITRHIMMHQVLYIVQLPNEEGDMHII